MLIHLKWMSIHLKIDWIFHHVPVISFLFLHALGSTFPIFLVLTSPLQQHLRISNNCPRVVPAESGDHRMVRNTRVLGSIGIIIPSPTWGWTLKWWVSPTPMGFPTKKVILGCEMGVPPFKETPTWVQSSKCQTCTWFSPLPSCYLVPPTIRKNPADSLYLTQTTV